MDSLVYNTDVWRKLHTFLDYNSRISLNRVFSEAQEIKKFTRKQIEAHHVFSLSREYVRMTIATKGDDRKVARLFAMLLNTKFRILMKNREFREILIQKCREFEREIDERYRGVIQTVLKRALDVEGDLGKLTAITV
jgi:hypothetical protein